MILDNLIKSPFNSIFLTREGGNSINSVLALSQQYRPLGFFARSSFLEEMKKL